MLHIISGGDSGGAKTHVFALLDALKKYIDVKVVCLIPGVFYQEILERDVETVLLEQKTRFDLSVLNQLTELIKKDGYDIIHVHGARANFIATAIKGRIRIPVVTTVHSDYMLDFTETLYKKVVYTGINMVALRFLDYYIGVSENFKKMLVSRGFSPKKIFTVYNGMDYSGEPEYLSKTEFAEKYKIEYSRELCYVGIIGRFDKVKGHEIFIRGAAEAVKRNPNLRFLLAGEGPDREYLEALAAALGIGDKVHFLGFIKDIYSFINFIDINTLTSLSESFPYVLLEGARMKKPTVSSAVGGIPDLIEDGVTGFLFESGNYGEFAERIYELSESRVKCAELGEALYEKAISTFSNDSLARTHVDIYEKILKDYYDKKAYDVVMSGYYGFRNNGDDALLTAIIRNLREQESGIRILVLSARPKATQREFLIDCANRFNPVSMIRAFKNSRLFLSGGGTLIHDATSSHSLYYYLTTIWLAKKMGMKIMMYANGFGPLKEKNVEAAKKVTETVDYITLRDEVSLEELRKHGIVNPNAEVTADPAITLKPASRGTIERAMKNEGLSPDEKYFGISVRKWQRLDPLFPHKVAAYADMIYEKYGLKTVLLPFKESEDLELSKEIAAKMKNPSHIVKCGYPSETLMGIISHCSMLMGMRLHSLIYATAVTVPVIGLVYDIKVRGFLKYINQEFIGNPEDFDSTLMAEYAEHIMSNREEITERLSESNRELIIKAKRNAVIAIGLLNGGKNEDN